MGKTTKIAYCDSTINPVMGCTGCELYSRDPKRNHCYAARLCRRYAGRKGWPKSFEQPEFFPGRIEQALHWSDLTGTDRPDKPWLNGMPRLVFVNDLGDGFGPSVLVEDWLPCLGFEAMAASPHIWLLLTKWPGRMATFFDWAGMDVPPNFWLGTTVTRPSNMDRLYKLLQIPARVHWLSVEPMLAPLDISHELHGAPEQIGWSDWEQTMPPPDWVILGCESGPNRRNLPHHWAASLVRQCCKTRTPVFVKQLSLNGRVSHDSAEWSGLLTRREMPNVD